MSGKGTVMRTDPADIEYLYDGSLPGLYCCVHESVYARQLPAGIQAEAAAQPTLFETRLIETDLEKARRVRASVPVKISPYAQELAENVFLSCLPQKELAILRFLLLGYREKDRVVNMLGHPDVAPLIDAEKHLLHEAHLLTGFVRFSDYGGVLGATISPKNFVLPYITEHFVTRFPNEDFLIFDKTHKTALVYQNRQHRLIPLENVAFPQANETEERYRALWKDFYNNVAIQARINHKCRSSHMPKRYWENMLEVRHLL